MSRWPRVFSTALSTTERFVYGTVTLVFVGAFLATMWPLYTLLNHIRPLVLGIPFSLFALVTLVLACFASMLALFRWEEKRGKLE
jgi:ABC-type multidrug transport system permease subunit